MFLYYFFQPFALKSAFSVFLVVVVAVCFVSNCWAAAVNLLLYEFEHILQHPLHHQGQELPGKYFLLLLLFVKFSDAEFLMP
jgi:hypothetical protein